MPPGGGAGLLGLDSSPEPKLYSRLREHARSVNSAGNLDIADFRCRYLIVDDIWIPLAERLLIGHYRPLWNGVVKGFGIHAPGGKPGGTKGRGGQMKSAWDTLHPGRPFAEGRETTLRGTDIRKKIKTHLEAHPPQQGEPPVLADDLPPDASSN
jgi:Eco29kI restriction endonuclease